MPNGRMTKKPIPTPDTAREPERVIVILDPDIIDMIEEHRRARTKIPTRADAIRELLKAGFASFKARK